MVALAAAWGGSWLVISGIQRLLTAQRYLTILQQAAPHWARAVTEHAEVVLVGLITAFDPQYIARLQLTGGQSVALGIGLLLVGAWFWKKGEAVTPRMRGQAI